MNDLYNSKVDFVVYLSEQDYKKVRTYHIEEAAEEFGLTKNQGILAWKNFVEFGTPDLRSKGLHGKGTPSAVKKYNKMLNQYKANPNFDLDLKKKVLRDYFNGELVRVIVQKHNISVNQLYSTIKRLNVTGKIENKKVFDWSKYRKIDIKIVALLNSGRKEFDKKDYATAVRLKTVLDKYLLND